MACSGAASESLFAGCQDYYLGKPYLADYVSCAGCGMIQQSPLPVDVSTFYDAYPIHQSKSPLHAMMRKLVMSPVYFHDRDVPRGSTVLDYGCGDGWFLEGLKARGLNGVGFEMDAAHAARLSKDLELPILSDRDSLLEQWAGRADVVTMHFVLEHVMDLPGTFDTVRKLLKPGGRFYFVVPNARSFEAKLFGKKWHNLDPPRHISFPEEKQVRALGRASRLELKSSRSVPFPNGFAGSLPVVLTGRFRFVVFLLALPLGILFSRLFPDGAKAFWLTRNEQV